MYAETGLMFPYFQNFSTDGQQFDDFCHSQKSITCLDNLIQTSTVSDYDLGGEGDLFKAPEPIIIEPLISGLDPITSTISMIACGEDTLTPQELKVTDIESLQKEEFLNDVFYECKNILAQEAAAATESSPLSEVLSFSFPVTTDENTENLHPSCQIRKSMSSDSLNSMDWIQGAQIKSSFLNFSELDFGNAYGMRRAFSDGDIKTLVDGNTGLIHYPLGQPPVMSERTLEDRMQKLSRYRNKKTKRNFGRKIKYACRKALADSQPRIRGRFAKTDESEMLRK